MNKTDFIVITSIIRGIKQLFFFYFSIHVLFSAIRIAGHSAGAHLTLWLMNYLIRNSHKQLHLIRTLYLIAGIYDLTELRFTDTNEQNIFGLNDESTIRLSPMFFQFDQWHNIDVDIKIVLDEFDAPKFDQQNRQICDIFMENELKVELIMMPDLDHFNVVEKLSEEEYELTRIIINDYKM